MGFVFQSFHILPYLTVAQNVALPLALNGMRNKPMSRRVAALLESVKLRERGESMPHQPSGGETQRGAVPRAPGAPPRPVFAGEPTGDLHPGSAKGGPGVLRRGGKGERA